MSKRSTVTKFVFDSTLGTLEMVISKIRCLLILLLVANPILAQEDYRQYGVNDSTSYTLNPDTVIIATRHELFFGSSAGETLIHDFATGDESFYIRDLNIITATDWYVIFGPRNWNPEAVLYKTVDKGVTWSIDDSHVAVAQTAVEDGEVSQFDALWQLHKVSADTLLLFVGYYQSGIFFSTDGGTSWDLWFGNYMANYRGLLKCHDEYFLWALEGDGFSGSMFPFESSLLLSPDTNEAWTKYNLEGFHPSCQNGSPGCVYAPNSISEYEQYLYFVEYVDSLCASTPTGIAIEPPVSRMSVSPNPSVDGVWKVGWDAAFRPKWYRVFNSLGAEIKFGMIDTDGSMRIDLSDHGKGPYVLVVGSSHGVSTTRLWY